MFDGDNILQSPRSAALNAGANESLRLLSDSPHRGLRLRLQGLIVICAVFVLGAGVVLWAWGVPTQRHNPGFWHVALVSMLFWLSVSQGMLALSAILRVTHASWRYPLNRLLDMASLFGLWAGALLPLFVYVRHQIYALGAAQASNNLWRVAGSTGWDALAVGTAYVSGWLLLYLTSLPDFAILRDRAPEGSSAQKFYRRLAGQWTGAERQWRVLRRAEGVLVVGVIASFVGSQTILGWDFQLAAARNWDSSIFAPLFTIGSLLGAVAMTVLVISVVRTLLRGGGELIPVAIYDNLGKMMIGLGLVWFYFRFCDFLTAWYGHIPDEWNLQNDRTGVFPVLVGLMVVGCFGAPVFGNFFRFVRRSPLLLGGISVLVLAGLAAQRYLDTVPTFAPKFDPQSLLPTVPGVLVFVGLGAMFVLTYLLAARYFPILSWWGMAKQATRTAERRVGNAVVTVMVEDPPVWET